MTSARPAIRPRLATAGPRDASWIAKVAAPLFDHPTDARALRAYLGDPRNVFFLASVGGQPAGFLRATSLRQPHTRSPQMFLYEIAVAPGFRRRGVGRALVERLLAYCRRRRYEEVFVFTEPSNRAAVRLYRRTGAVTETPADRMFVYKLSAEAHRRG